MRMIRLIALIMLNCTTYHGHHEILPSWFRIFPSITVQTPLHNPNFLFRQAIQRINQLVYFGYVINL